MPKYWLFYFTLWNF